MILSFKYRLLPTKKQHSALARILDSQRELYNAALAERVDCYRKTGKGRSYVDQCRALTDWRACDPDARSVPANLQRWTLHRLAEAYESFFRRVEQKRGKVGFPRFRGSGWWRSFGFRQFSGIRFDGKRIRFATMPGGLRVHCHRPLPAGRPLSCILTKDDKGWSVVFHMRSTIQAKREILHKVGIDLGLSKLAVLSTGDKVPNPRVARRAEGKLRRYQRLLSRCKKGSSGRSKARNSVARAHRGIVNERNTYLHQVSAGLVRRFDLIAIENLNVKGLAGGMLAKSVHDASWGRLRQMLTYKAERAGCELIEVDPRHTSQTCPQCGQVAAKTLSQRAHKCDCGCSMDRDHAAALVILSKAVAGLEAHNAAGCGERAPRNIAIREKLPTVMK